MSAALTTNVDQRLLRTTKFPPEFNTKVDMRKVNINIIKNWAQSEIVKILNNDDDVVTELVFNILEESSQPNVKALQIQLQGFLDKDAAPFCQQLWKLCLSAQENPNGIPQELIEAKKAELTQEKAEKERAHEEAIRREEADRQRESEMARVRERGRNERARGRGGRDFDRRPPRDSRSPPRRRRDDDDFRRAPRTDSYIPSNAGRRRRSPSYGRANPRSRSRSPPRKSRREERSASRTPPTRRKRANTSSERSSSPERKQNGDRDSRADQHKRDTSRSPPRKRHAQPSRQTQRDPRNKRNRSRSPPSKRDRRASSSSSQASSSMSPPSDKSPALKKKEPQLAPDDLMAVDRRKERPEALRLRHETTSPSRSRSATPSTNERSRDTTTSVKDANGHAKEDTTMAGAEDVE